MSVSLDSVVSVRRDGAQPRKGAGRSAELAAQESVQAGPGCYLCELARRVSVSLAIFVAGAILIALFSDLAQNIDYNALLEALRRTAASAIGWSICATALSFAALVGRDACALRYVGARAPLPALLLASFCGTALGNAVGFGALTAAAVRYRIYGAVGIKPDDIARLVLFIAGGFGLGLAGIGGLTGLLEAAPVADLLGWPPDLLRGAAGIALATAACIVVFGLRGKIRVGRFWLAAPSKTLATTQFALTSIRLIGAAAALWTLLPETPISFFSFATIFSAATALGAISHVPGGIGVFEAVVLWAFRGRASSDAIAAALLAYRGVYYLLPLVLSAALFAFFEFRVTVGRQARKQRRSRCSGCSAAFAQLHGRHDICNRNHVACVRRHADFRPSAGDSFRATASVDG